MGCSIITYQQVLYSMAGRQFTPRVRCLIASLLIVIASIAHSHCHVLSSGWLVAVCAVTRCALGASLLAVHTALLAALSGSLPPTAPMPRCAATGRTPATPLPPDLAAAVAAHEEAGRADLALSALKLWLDRAADQLAMEGSTSSTTLLHHVIGTEAGTIRGQVATALSMVDQLVATALSVEQRQSSPFLRSVEEEAHAEWQGRLLQSLQLYEDKLAAIERAEAAERSLELYQDRGAAATPRDRQGQQERGEQEQIQLVRAAISTVVSSGQLGMDCSVLASTPRVCLLTACGTRGGARCDGVCGCVRRER
eukprot:COSAG01_NODE_10342_length_2189_cov_11.369856_1_plen_310_part_00